MSAANLYLLIYYFYLGGSNAPEKGELVEVAYYILINIYYCLVPVNKHEHIVSPRVCRIHVCLLEPNSNKHQSVYSMLLPQAPLSSGRRFPLSKSTQIIVDK